MVKIDSAYIIFLILDRVGGNTSLMTMVYRDGKSLFFFLTAARLNLEVGVIYYLYLFGRSCVGIE